MDRDTEDIARGWQALQSKYGGRVILAALLFVILIAAAVWGYSYWHQSKPVTYAPQQKAETPQGVREAAENAGVHISPGQAKEVAQTIKESTTRPPEQIICTTGAGMSQTLADSRKQAGAQAQIVTDPARPDKPPGKPAADQPINLNVYNIKPYPKRLLELTVCRNAADVAYMMRVQVFGLTGYLGPVVSYNADRTGSKTRVGVRLSLPLD